MLTSHVRRNRRNQVVVTFRAADIHDVMRWAILMLRGHVEFCEIGEKTLQALRRQVGPAAFDSYLLRILGAKSLTYEDIRARSIRKRNRNG